MKLDDGNIINDVTLIKETFIEHYKLVWSESTTEPKINKNMKEKLYNRVAKLNERQ